MAFRFQRRIKILPGLTLNVSKSGLGLSAGVRGARVSIGPNGVHSHAGIPGTGIAFRQKHGSRPARGGRRAAGNAGNAAAARTEDRTDLRSLTVRVDPETGETAFVLADGGGQIPIARLRRLSPGVDAFLADALEEECARRNGELESMRTLHTAIPHPDAGGHEPAAVFDLAAPVLPLPAEPGLMAKLWPPERRRVESANAARLAAHDRAMGAWELTRDRFLQQQSDARSRRQRVSRGDLDAMTDELSFRFNRLVWPLASEVDFDLGHEPHTIALDVDLPTEEQFPAREWRLAASRLRLLVKNLSATARRGIYRDYVHSVALRMMGEVFAGLPTIENVLLSGYTQVADSQRGGMVDSYLFSFMASRGEWRGIRFDALESLQPAEAVERFQLRRNMTSTGIFRPIEPFGPEALDS